MDIDPGEIGRNYPVAVGVVGDCKMVLRQLLDAVRGRPKPRLDTWLAEVEKAKAEWETFLKPRRASGKAPIQFERVLDEASKALPSNAVVFVDAGNTGGWVVQHWPTRMPYGHQAAGGLNAMGWAPAAPLGAQIADPSRPCMCICGDGSFMMTPHVVATAVEYSLPVIWLVLNDYSWGAIKGLQGAYFDAKEIATTFKVHQKGQLYNPDFALWAKACGAEGEQIKRPERSGAGAGARREVWPAVCAGRDHGSRRGGAVHRQLADATYPGGRAGVRQAQDALRGATDDCAQRVLRSE